MSAPTPQIDARPPRSGGTTTTRGGTRLTAIPIEPTTLEPTALEPTALEPRPSIHSPTDIILVATDVARPTLSAREVEVLLSWFRCDSKPAVARSLFLSLGTVNTHLTRIRSKYAAVGRPAPTKASLVARALQDGLIDISEL